MTDQTVLTMFCAVMLDFVWVNLKISCARFKGEKKRPEGRLLACPQGFTSSCNKRCQTG